MKASASYLQDSALLVIQNNVDAENDEDIQQGCILVPWNKAFVKSYSPPFQKFFMTEPVDQGGGHQKVLVVMRCFFLFLQDGV